MAVVDFIFGFSRGKLSNSFLLQLWCFSLQRDKCQSDAWQECPPVLGGSVPGIWLGMKEEHVQLQGYHVFCLEFPYVQGEQTQSLAQLNAVFLFVLLASVNMLSKQDQWQGFCASIMFQLVLFMPRQVHCPGIQRAFFLSILIPASGPRQPTSVTAPPNLRRGRF